MILWYHFLASEGLYSSPFGFSIFLLVPQAGLEPALPKKEDFESSASTIPPSGHAQYCIEVVLRLKRKYELSRAVLDILSLPSTLSPL